jgi:hypothetical protein
MFAIDEADYKRFVEDMPSWYLSGSTNKYLSCDWHNSPVGRVKVRLHKLIMLGVQDTDSVVDHMNGDTFDNRRCNLRIISQGQNVDHRPNPNKNNTSGVRGLYWCKTNNRWIARINHREQTWWTKNYKEDEFEQAREEITQKREKYNIIFGITCNPPPKLEELKGNEVIIEKWIEEHPGSVSNKASKESRDAYDESRRAATQHKRGEKYQELLRMEQTPEVIKKLKRLDADQKRAESRRRKN